jgi:hypothetical protein
MRADIYNRKDDILEWILENKPKAYMCRELKCKPSTLNNWLDKLGIKYEGNQGSKGIRTDPKRLSASEYANKKYGIATYKLKLKLFEDGIKEKVCECCGIAEWMGKEAPLELHHIDGDRFNNDFDNLQILCSNCHSQTPNNSGKKTKK